MIGEPCENCGSEVAVMTRGPATDTVDGRPVRLWPGEGPGIVIDPQRGPTLYERHNELYSAHSVSCDSWWEPHTPDRCRSARRSR